MKSISCLQKNLIYINGSKGKEIMLHSPSTANVELLKISKVENTVYHRLILLLVVT
jgi:hypothetical protein